jgi:hypothetical protein
VGRLVTIPDGSEWIWMHLTPATLKYYQERVTCFGFTRMKELVLGCGKDRIQENRY